MPLPAHDQLPVHVLDSDPNRLVVPAAALALERAEKFAFEPQLGLQSWAPRPLIVERPMFMISAWEWLHQNLGYCRKLDGSFGESPMSSVINPSLKMH